MCSPGIQQSHCAVPRPALHADHQGGVLRDVLHLEEVPEPGLAQLVLDTLQQQLGNTRAAQSAGLTIRVYKNNLLVKFTVFVEENPKCLSIFFVSIDNRGTLNLWRCGLRI